ncbi:MAG: YtxH domain-containing protein [Anaerolineae bacterium]|nr:YtxH domain-containing protein [Anaerolineae bacterium]
MDKNQIFNFILGLFSGALAGAAVTLLLAPHSGADARKMISNQVQEIIEAGKQARMDRRAALEAEYKAAIRIPLPLEQQEKD